MAILAHFDPKTKDCEPLSEHLRLVAKRAREFADIFSASEEAYVTGLLHDLGKYGELFQRRLLGEAHGVDHWSAGAWQALQIYQINGIASALAIQGHHIGLQVGSKDYLAKINPTLLSKNHPLGLSLSSGDISQLCADGLKLPGKQDIRSIYQWGLNNASSMLDVRMLFSTLVDADFLETEAWFNRDQKGNRQYRPIGLDLNPNKALSALLTYVKKVTASSRASQKMQELRKTLFSKCLEEGQKAEQGLFTLTAPTGSGKTLAMLAFALAQAVKHKLRRIIVVLPYLTIIEQTGRVYREVFLEFLKDNDLKGYLIEDHSLASFKIQRTQPDEEGNYERLFSENWDAPVIITTNVQFLESLFSNQPAACRKLHRIAKSVILFDEVQTLPLQVVIPTLAVISRMVEKYGVSAVFATATQPAFTHLGEQVKKHASLGWQPHEIVHDTSGLFNRAKRTEIEISNTGLTSKWDQIGEDIAKEPQVLCIVNTKKHAKLLFEKVKTKRSTNIYHLSTNMCPAHRKQILQNIKSLLDADAPCCLISTQCVEAGVDIDFPVVFRSIGPLDAIAQAAGRCNRNDRWKTGIVKVFCPEEESFPDEAYRQASEVARSLIITEEKVDIANLELFQNYYRQLYSIRGLTNADPDQDKLINAIIRQDFAEVSALYRLIPQDTINVLVPYDKSEYHRLARDVRQNGITYAWINEARLHSVSLFRPRSTQDALYACLEPIRIKPDRPQESSEWYIYRKEEDYDSETGLNPSFSSEAIIA